MERLKKLLALVPLFSMLLFPRILRGISGEIYDAHNGTSSGGTAVSCWINDGSSGTQNVNCTPWGDWGVSPGNFLWPPEIGDTVKMSASKVIGSETYTTHMRDTLQVAGSPHNGILPTAFLDDPNKDVRANSFGIWHITDTSNANDTLKAEGWLNKNPDQKISFYNYFWENGNYVDTSDIYPQVYLNLEKQDSLWNQGDSATIRLCKQIGDTTWEADTTFPIDTLAHGGATMFENIIFPERMYVVDTTAPSISNMTEWPDTNYQGPYAVSYDRTDESSISGDSLTYKINQGSEQTVPADSIVGDKAYCTIDTVIAPNDSVHYKVKTVDASTNENVAYWPGPTENNYYSFKVKSIGAEEPINLNKKEVKIGPNPFYSNISISWPVEKAQLNIYDISGRLVNKVPVNNYEAKWGKDASKGIYFVKSKPGELNGKIEIKNKVWKLIKL